LENLSSILDTRSFMPHGTCLLWRPELLYLHVVSDLLIAASYVAIPVALSYFVSKREDLRFGYIFFLFGAFILACGTTHVMEVWTIWDPVYGTSGLIKAFTALVSVATAVILWPLIPKALKVPSIGQLEAVNRELHFEVGERKKAEIEVRRLNADLEEVVAERTAQLVESNLRLTEESAALKRSEEKYRFVTEHAGDWAFWIDQDGRYAYCSPSCLELTGFTAREFEADPQLFERRVHPQDLSRFRHCRQGAGDGEPVDQEFRIRHRDGTERWLNHRCQPVHGDDGRFLGYRGSHRDVTDRKRVELELDRYRAHLEQLVSERTVELCEAKAAAEDASRAKSQFLANMSHEIRTPMNAILGLNYLLGKTALSVQQQDYGHKIEGAAKSLLGILNDILDFSKVEAGKITLEQIPFQPDEVLRNLAVILAASAQDKDIEVLFRIDPCTPPRVMGDPLRLQQVLINLGGNAVKFTERGEVVVSVGPHPATEDRVGLVFSIRDTGIGISPEQVARIFDGFSQAEASTTRRFGGTGLGLAISQRLVALMGGNLEVSSEPGRGSEFRFVAEFAIAEDTAPQREPYAVPHLHTLIVDDNATAREVLADMVQSLGWSCETLASGVDALERLEGGLGPAPDLILLDWRMPGLSGMDTARRIREIEKAGGHRSALIMITAHSREALADTGNLLDGFLTKPATASMLVDAVAEITHGDAVRPGRGRLARRRLKGLRLLLAEDNAINQQVAREILEGEGAEVVTAEHGGEAIERVCSAQSRFDAVLMDVQMPELDGYQATRELRARGYLQLPIIAMTANAMASDRDECLRQGMNDHVAKPIDVEALIATLGHYCTLPEPEELAAETPPAPVPVLAEGIELESALARIGGDRGLYGRICHDFIAQQADAPNRIAAVLDAGDRPQAIRLAHTLKGLAAALGATALAAPAARIEAALQEGSEPTEVAADLGELGEAMFLILPELERLADEFCPPSPEPAAAGSGSLQDALLELEALLEENDLAAVDRFERIAGHFPAALSVPVATLRTALGQLDFDAARTGCADLKLWLDREVPE
jgi:PAS domain S-box-containing protein